MPPSFISSAEDIGKRFNVNEQTARTHLNKLAARGLVRLEQERKPSGQYGAGGYIAIRADTPKSPSGKKAPTEKAPTTLPSETDFSTPSGTVSSSLKEGKGYTPSPGALAVSAKASPGKAQAKSTTYAKRKAAKEQRDIEKLYKRTGVECPLKLPAGDPLAGTPFDRPATYAEAVKCVTEELERKAYDKANAGVDIFDEGDGKHLVDLEFYENATDEAFADTYAISDECLRDGIEQATGGRVKPALLDERGLQMVRLMLARFMEDTADAEEAFDILLGYLRHRIGTVDKAWLNSWNLVARRFAGALYGGGIDSITQA